MHHDVKRALEALGVGEIPRAVGIGARWVGGSGASLVARSPIDGSTLAEFASASPRSSERGDWCCARDFAAWRDTPAPVRGELVRRIGEALRKQISELATLVAWEIGKILPEARGEVQEVIDICDFAVGLSRQLYGKTIASERPGHRLTEYWHPLGPVGVISAFNFPVAVWAWNAMIGLVCGDPIVWKPSEKTPLCALACQALVQNVIASTPGTPSGISNVVVGGRGGRQSAGGVAATAADFGDGFGADGPRRRSNRCGSPGALATGTGRQQRHDRWPIG